ncbi:MAG: hypothetical protein M1832_005599 [Thelocarpon impressellum]|nr:MAG: hypothetical protein M1832_005599 [Thelocarpon impressellum]
MDDMATPVVVEPSPDHVLPHDGGPLVAAAHARDGKRHLLLAASGSVAAIKIPEMVRALGQRHPPSALSIRLVLTASAARFLAGQSAEQPTLSQLRALPLVDAVYRDEDEWAAPGWTRGAPILHIELRRWAHLMVVAPLSANSLAKMVAGLSDSLLLSVIRAWDATGEVEGRPAAKKRIVVAPAMNTAMWRHPLTRRQVDVLERDWGGPDGWVDVLRPVEKELACGDVGDGAMHDWRDVVAVAEERLGLSR